LAGAAISWASKRQQTVALSSTEAEYMAACAATQEAMHLRTLLKDLGQEQAKATVLHQDNQGAIKIAKNFTSNKRTKHIDIKYHFVKEKIQTKEIHLKYKSTEKMIANCLTKPVGKQIIDRAKKKMFGQVHQDHKSEGEC
jgi:hypothetical protein